MLFKIPGWSSHPVNHRQRVTFHSFRLRGRADIRESASDHGGHKTENLCPIYPAVITHGVLLTLGSASDTYTYLHWV